MPSPHSLVRPLRPLTRTIRRHYAIPSRGPPNLQVFNSNTKWLQKERAASDVEASRRVDYLKDEVASRLCERLLVLIHYLPSCIKLTLRSGHPTPLQQRPGLRRQCL
jgi:NADH dehydrogenase [ubiquinone] 1 alpha subcomplex assembly factor 5